MRLEQSGDHWLVVDKHGNIMLRTHSKPIAQSYLKKMSEK